MAIDGARIQRITKEGLFYLDDEGIEQFIDLEAIHLRKLAKFLDPKALRQYQARNAFDEDELEQAIEERKAIKDVGGWIPYEGGTMFIGMFLKVDVDTEPPTRFEINWDDIDQFEAALKHHGWVLYGSKRSGGLKPPRW